MALHRTSARWRRGLALALVTAGFWATLPAALKIALQRIDPWTLTWVRFLLAFVVLGLWLGARGQLRQFRGLARRDWLLLALAATTLLTRLGSGQILLFIYFVASIALLPLARPGAVLALRGLSLWMVVYAAINTLGAYGAFAEALAHWEASRVSAVLALTPLLAVATVEEVHALAPTVLAGESVRTLGWIGAGMIVTGSGLASVARKRGE